MFVSQKFHWPKLREKSTHEGNAQSNNTAIYIKLCALLSNIILPV